MHRFVAVTVVVAATALGWSGQAFALGCDAKAPTPGHTVGSLGYTDVPPTPCPTGHYAALQKKRNGSALFAQPKADPFATDPANNATTNGATR